jgi:protein gp37
MGDKTAISWTRYTWNPWRGCQRVSPGCAHCYMFTAQEKRAEESGDFETWNPTIIHRTTTWRDPDRWQREAAAAGRTERVFSCSWSDFFIPAADGWRPEAWQIIRRTPNLIYQIPTKRPENIPDRLPPDWGNGYPNVWLGVSVENPRYLWRVDALRKIPAVVHFISAEPLLAPLSDLDLTDIEWLIVGGESGPGFRPMLYEWARQLLAKAHRAGTAYFFKQSAAIRTEIGTTLDGKVYHEYPKTGYQATQIR